MEGEKKKWVMFNGRRRDRSLEMERTGWGFRRRLFQPFFGKEGERRGSAAILRCRVVVGNESLWSKNVEGWRGSYFRKKVGQRREEGPVDTFVVSTSTRTTYNNMAAATPTIPGAYLFQAFSTAWRFSNS